jgi:hypothetical protein
MTGRCVSQVGFALVLTVYAPLRAQMLAQGSALTITTPSMTATLQNADLVHLGNTITGENYLQPNNTASLLDLTMLNPSGATLRFTNWSVQKNKSTGQNVASIAFQDSTRSGTFNITVDPQTQELVVTLQGSSHSAGVRALSWGMQGIDLSAGRVILPSQGGNYIDAKYTLAASLQYPVTWAAQMVLYEASHGGFLVYSTDRSFQFKDLHLMAPNSIANLQVGAEATAPWTTATSIGAMEWRVNVFAGDWRAGATLYKNWSSTVWPSAAANSETEWIRGIEAVLAVEVLNAPAFLDTLATLVDPTKTLLHIPYWTSSASGTNYPDYTPSALLKPFVDSAHRFGFHVELYFNAIGVDPANPAYPQLQLFQMKTPDTLQLTGWRWNSPSDPTREAYISPASSAWRKLLLDRIQAAVVAVQPDAIHLDAVPNLVNDGNGLIDGLTSEQGLAQLLLEAQARFPNIVFGTEGMTEASLQHSKTAQSWPAPFMGILPGHPITTFLQGDQISFHGHLNQPNPGEPGFLQWEQQYEAQGVLPLMHVDAVYRASELAFARLFGQMQKWQAHNYGPDWGGDWSSWDFRYKGSDGSAATLTNAATLTTLTDPSGIVYQRAHGVTQILTTRYVDQWPAFDNQELYGLDPELEYWLDAVPRPTTQAHITSLPSNVKLGLNTRVSTSVASIGLVPVGNVSFDFFANFAAAAKGSTTNGADAPSCAVCVMTVTEDIVGGIIRPSIFEQPPAIGSQSFIEFSVPLPQGNSVAFEFAAGIDDGAARTAPVYFSVAVNGQQVWTEAVAKGYWLASSLDLSPWAGQTVRLRLITDGGPAGNASAWAAWSALELNAGASNASPPVNIDLPVNAAIASFSGGGTIQLSPGGVMVSDSVIPQSFVLFLASGSAVSVGQSLVSIPYSIYTADPGALPIASNPTYSSASVGSGSSGAVVKAGVLALPAASNGRSIAAFNVNLPADKPVQLSFGTGLSDGSSASGVGVILAVLVNGSPAWTQTVTAPGWKYGSVDLSGFQGQNVLIELVSDTGTTGSFVVPLWSDLTIQAR